MELWVDAYQRDRANLEPRRLIESYTGSFSGVVGGGAWLTLIERDGRRGLETIDLQTGTRRVIWAPDGVLLTSIPSWITGDSVGTVARTSGLDNFDTLILLDRDLAEPVD